MKEVETTKRNNGKKNIPKNSLVAKRMGNWERGGGEERQTEIKEF
jgi:hypothetical protein